MFTRKVNFYLRVFEDRPTLLRERDKAIFQAYLSLFVSRGYKLFEFSFNEVDFARVERFARVRVPLARYLMFLKLITETRQKHLFIKASNKCMRTHKSYDKKTDLAVIFLQMLSIPQVW